MVLTGHNRKNMALGLYGTDSVVALGAAVADNTLVAHSGKLTPFTKQGVTSVATIKDSTDTTTYTAVTDYILDLPYGFITVAGGAIVDGSTVHAVYNHGAYINVTGLTATIPERWLRFQGLNTAESDEPVIVDIYKVNTQPLSELALIGSEYQSMPIEGSALLDTTRPSNPYFNYARVSTL